MWKSKDMSRLDSLDTTVQQNPVVEAAAVSLATKVGMGGGSAASAVGWLASNNTVVVIGLFVTVVGFLINLFFQYRRDKRELREYEFKMRLELAEEQRNVELHKVQMSALKRRSSDGE